MRVSVGTEESRISYVEGHSNGKGTYLNRVRKIWQVVYVVYMGNVTIIEERLDWRRKRDRIEAKIKRRKTMSNECTRYTLTQGCGES